MQFIFRGQRWHVPVIELLLLSIGPILFISALRIVVWPVTDETLAFFSTSLHENVRWGVEGLIFIYFWVIRSIFTCQTVRRID